MGKKVYIENKDNLVSNMFADWGFELAVHHSEADMIVFTGGSDIAPAAYLEAPQKECGPPNMIRDLNCFGLYNYGILNGMPMIGICRGAQFLTVAQGGKLDQHIEGHATGQTHYITFTNGNTMSVTSTHHQAMRPARDVDVLATGPGDVVEVTMTEIFGATQLCVQGHPEYVLKDHPFQIWFMELAAMIMDLEVEDA